MGEVTATLPALAAVVGEAFPELEGRAIAVSEIDLFRDKTLMPTLPVATVALVKETSSQAAHGGAITLTSDILVHFIFDPVKYTLSDGADSPFFAFYDYETIRDRLLHALEGWRTPKNAPIAYSALDVESTELAVYLTFRFQVTEYWCDPYPGTDPCKVEPMVKLYSAPSVFYPDAQDCTQAPDPCENLAN